MTKKDIQELRKIIRRSLIELLKSDEQLMEMVTTSNVEGYDTPFAFKGEDDWDEEEQKEKAKKLAGWY